MPGHRPHPLNPRRFLTRDLLALDSLFHRAHLVTEVDCTALETFRTAHISDEPTQPTVDMCALYALAQVLARPEHAVFNGHERRYPRPRFVTYDDVDLCFFVERYRGGERHVFLRLLPNAQAMSFEDLAAAVRHWHTVEDFRHWPRRAAPLRLVPGPARRALFRLYYASSPGGKQRMTGTCTYLSTPDSPAAGTLIPYAPGITTVSLGAVADRPVVRDGQVVAARTAHLTLTYDRGVADDTQAARLIEDLRKFLENLKRAPDGGRT
ncbi:2-oxo acid dehydrogenase subunit E2 [Streptomyces sp. TRM70308]|uniref:2-oxo acid dehydrogenase subunit E2 n=1 Tax=Streptomyces sp. TRM70308 TaxID=3131932 RepID=UPI003CFE68E9